VTTSTATATIAATAQAGTALGVDVVGAVIELIGVVLVEAPVDALDVNVLVAVDVVTELIGVLLVEAPVAIMLTVPEK